MEGSFKIVEDDAMKALCEREFNEADDFTEDDKLVMQFFENNVTDDVDKL